MKTPMLAICLIVIFSGLFNGCATSPEAAKRANEQPGAAPEKWEKDNRDKTLADELLQGGLQAIGWAVNR